MDDGAVDGDRMHDAELAELAHERRARVDDAVPAKLGQHARGAVAAEPALERGAVFDEDRMVERRDQTTVVVIVAHPRVAVGRAPQTGVLPDLPGGAVLEHLADTDLGVGPRARRRLLARGPDRRGVDERRMHGVVVVLEHQLPVALIRVLEHAARDLDLTVGRALDEIVERRPQRTEEVQERWPVGRQRGEEEAAIDVDPRHAREAAADRLGDRAIVPVGPRHAAEGAVRRVRPAVIRADELTRRAGGRLAHARAPVNAAVDEHAHRVVRVADHDHRLAAHPGREEVARAPDLALVSQDEPGAPEDPVHLELEQHGIGVDGTVDAVGLDQVLDGSGVHGSVL